ncbi:MAG: PTS sugar transporter subunit IIA [Planctomycetota bacterium]|nr:PTS sugar transporter subunit IIA [Planctomycetota bacterium]
MTISLESILPPERVLLLESTNKKDALRELARTVSEAPEVADGERLIEAIMEREAIMSTGIGLGIAIPHAKIESVTDFVIGLGKSNAGIEFNSLDEKPVHFLVMIAGPKDQQERYLQLLAKITLKLKDSTVRRRLSEASSVDEIRSALS